MKYLFITLQYLLPQQTLSRGVGVLARSEIIWLKNLLIKAFIKAYKVDLEEAEYQQPEDYLSFNQFFTRALKDGARPIGSDICSPADGAISEIGAINEGRLLQAKGKQFELSALLGSAEDSKAFKNGRFATVYLSPSDYHRVHMPVAGKLVKTRYIPGQLFSVNNTTAANVNNLFARNERLVCLFETEHGPMAVILVGAMIVAGISTVWEPDLKPAPYTVLETLHEDTELRFAAGDELGRFYLGSTAIVLLPDEIAEWRDDLAAGCTVKMGEAIGALNAAKIET